MYVSICCRTRYQVLSNWHQIDFIQILDSQKLAYYPQAHQVPSTNICEVPLGVKGMCSWTWRTRHTNDMNKSWNSQKGRLISTWVKFLLGNRIWFRSSRSHRLWRKGKGGQNKQCAQTGKRPERCQWQISLREGRSSSSDSFEKRQSSTLAWKELRVSGKNTGLREFPLLALAKWSWEKLVYLGFSFLTWKQKG